MTDFTKTREMFHIPEGMIYISCRTRSTFEYWLGGHPIVTRFALNRLGEIARIYQFQHYPPQGNWDG